ncbi:MAG: pilus assembly protein PilM [Omnitrophica bacterium]|nr:pilus assembly protein PilM [Candidatus Omnitrophota bacterium]
MSIKKFFTKDFVIGLDIGASSVKIAQFKKSEEGLYLVKADLREIKPTTDPALRTKAIAEALKGLFAGIDLKKSKVIAHINCPKTAIKLTHAPYMPKSELYAGMKLEAKTDFPFPIDDSLLDYEIFGDVVEKGVRKYEVAVSVSPKETVSRYLAILGKAGIKPVSFVPSPYALKKIAEVAQSKDGKAVCVVEIGKLHTELIILKGNTLVFSRKIPVAGEDFTKSMTIVLDSDRGKTQLSFDEAEKIKSEVGLPAESEPKIIDGKISTTEILSMLRVPAEQLATEIERCFDYYREESGGGKIETLVVFGGGASLGGLIKFLSGELGVEVKLGDPLEGFKVGPNAVRERNKTSYRMAPAIGSALSFGKGINLLPLEMKEEAKRAVKRGTIEIVATVVVLVSALLFVGMKIELGNLQTRISVAALELSGLAPDLKKAEAHHAANMVLVDEPHWEDIFKELGHRVPKHIHLTGITMREDVINMKGVVSSSDGEDILSDFILTLDEGIFKDVKLVKTRDLADKSGNEFELACWVD